MHRSADGLVVPDDNEHFPLLDGFRGVAMIVVLLQHLAYSYDGENPVIWFMIACNRMGWIGVDIFFVLSGFLITRRLLCARGCRNYYKSFYARRFLRVFPLYYAVLFVTLVVYPRLPYAVDPHQGWSPTAEFKHGGIAYWLYFSNIIDGIHGHWQHYKLAITWSLSIEEQFYLLWPLVVAKCGKRGIIAWCAGLFAVSAVCRLGVRLSGMPPLAGYVLTFCRVDGLGVGAFLALFYTPERREAYRVWGGRIAAAASVVILVLIVRILAQGNFANTIGGPQSYIHNEFWMQVVGFSTMAILFGGLLARMVVVGSDGGDGGRMDRFLRIPFLVFIGKLSYGIYLLHLHVTGPVHELFAWMGIPPIGTPVTDGQWFGRQILFYAVVGTLSTAVAWVSWTIWEHPILRLKKHVPYHVRESRG
jgi:peptidoglycan/LPS O-acetylase OafA/YrhL